MPPFCWRSKSLSAEAGPLQMICCVSRAKIDFEHWKIDVPCSFGVFFLILLFSQFWMILRWSDSQNRLRGLISCPGLLLNQSGLEFHMFSDFRVHIVFIRRPSAQLNCLKKWSPDHRSKIERCINISDCGKNCSAVNWMVKLYAVFILRPKFLDLSINFWHAN